MKKRTLAFMLALLAVLGTFPLSVLGITATEATSEEEALAWDGQYAPLYVQNGLTFLWTGEGNELGTTEAVSATITNLLNPEQSITRATEHRGKAQYLPAQRGRCIA